MSQHRLEVLRDFYGQILGWMQEGMPASKPLSPEVLIDVSGMSFEWSEPMGLEPREFIDIGPDKVVVVVNDVGTIKESGHEVRNEFAHLWTFRDDLAVRWELFTEKWHALEAAGQSA